MDEYTAATPPGWKPGMDHYPLRMYVDKLQLWWKQADVDVPHAAVLIAGRLKAGAGKLALKLKLERPRAHQPPTHDTGADALVRERIEEVRDPQTGIITQSRIPSGIERLIATLVERYGLDDQDTVTVALDHFFKFRREGLPLQEFVNEFVTRYDEAESKAGLQINNVGLCHLMLDYSNISDKSKDDLKLRVDGDISQYEQIKTLMLRMAKAPEREKLAYHADGWTAEDWQEADWLDGTEAYWYDEATEVWHGSKYDFYDDYDYDRVTGANDDSFYYGDYDYDYDYDYDRHLCSRMERRRQRGLLW